MVPEELTCGVRDFYSVLTEYEILTVLSDTYSVITAYHAGPDHLSPALQPLVLKYTAYDFGNELKSRLLCLLDGSTGSSLALQR